MLGRTPTYAELGVASVMWSEHCSYKSSRIHLRRLPTQGPRVIQGPGENAGVVDIGDGFAAVFKMESHNHPSYIEPYQGAATGVGGILRDVFTMGARPIAGLNSLRFGRPDHPKTPGLLRGVVAGIGGYGNCVGVPTVGGELFFDAAYDGNILVNAFMCGVARTDRIFYGRAGSARQPGALHRRQDRPRRHPRRHHGHRRVQPSEGPSQRPTVQVGDPFLGKLLIEACLEIFAEDLLEGVQDMGAAGLTSSSVEMAGRGGAGVEIDLDQVPRRAAGMTPYEMLLSESQERMLLVCKPGAEKRVREICDKWDLDAAVIGRVTDTGRWVIRATPGYDPLAAEPPGLTPEHRLRPAGVALDRRRAEVRSPARARRLARGAPRFRSRDHPRSGVVVRRASGDAGFAEHRLAALGLAPVRSDRARRHRRPAAARTRRWCACPASATETRVFKYLAFACDCNGAHGSARRVRGRRDGGRRGVPQPGVQRRSPDRDHRLPELRQSRKPDHHGPIFARDRRHGRACTALEVPIVSGNVSLYNETDGRAILPTPTVAAVGLVRDERAIVTAWFKQSGRDVFLLGAAGGRRSRRIGVRRSPQRRGRRAGAPDRSRARGPAAAAVGRARRGGAARERARRLRRRPGGRARRVLRGRSTTSCGWSARRSGCPEPAPTPCSARLRRES